VSEPKPFLLDAGGAAKRHAPATARNRDAIADVLAEFLPQHGTVVEIASGTGEHAIHFAARFPDLVWQPSDHDPAGLASIRAWMDEAALSNILPPVLIDAMAANWPMTQADAILCINMIHISPWSATRGLMARAGELLPMGAPLYLYGPYIRDDVETAPSNRAFDASLKERNPGWGLRNLRDVAQLAQEVGLTLERIVEMPANNLSLIFRRT
jgi:cyclopropane fatty-acyl-phospholipid synthase-like methyltransferase